MELDIERYDLRLVNRYAADGSGEVETDADMRPKTKGRYVLFDDHQIILAQLHKDLETAKRNEHNSEVAYKAAIEKQAELREDLKFSRATAATARNALADVIEKSKTVINGAEVIRAQRDEQDDIHTHEGWAMDELALAVKAASEATAQDAE